MKPSIYRRIRRRTANYDAVNTNKESKQEQSFFGDTGHEPFFKPAASLQNNAAVQRQCADCEGEEKAQRSPDKKEEDKKVQKKEEKKEEKVQRAADKKEEEKKVQKKEEKKEEEKVQKKEDKKEEEVQKKEGAAPATNTNATASNYISSINGKGQNMDAGVQSFYENRIGADFSDVKIHTGKEAADSAKDINAQAYAYGNHIVFNEGKYQPETSEGKHLLAHELAHVVQNNSKLKIDTVQRTANFIAGKPVYNVNLAEQFVKALNNDPDSEFGSTHPTINSADLTATSANPIKEPVDSDLSTAPVGTDFEASVTTIPVNETSFNMRLPQKGLTKWTSNTPITNVASLFQGMPCRISNTNIEVVGKPSNTSVITNTHVHEGVHAQHIRKCHNDYIVKFDKFLSTQKAKASNEAGSKKKLLTQISSMAQAMLSSFADAFTKLAGAFHGSKKGAKGNMAIKNIAPNCSKVEIHATS